MSMVEEQARIVSIDGEGIWIEARRQSACGRCAVRSGCGHGLLDSYFRGPSVHLHLAPDRAPAGLAAGDIVRVGIDERALLQASLRVYALPLAGFISGAVFGAYLGGGDAGAALAAFVGLALGLFGARSLGGAQGLEAPLILGRLGVGAEETARPVTVL